MVRSLISHGHGHGRMTGNSRNPDDCIHITGRRTTTCIYIFMVIPRQHPVLGRRVELSRLLVELDDVEGGSGRAH